MAGIFYISEALLLLSIITLVYLYLIYKNMRIPACAFVPCRPLAMQATCRTSHWRCRLLAEQPTFTRLV